MIKLIKKINKIYKNIKYKRNKIHCYTKPRREPFLSNKVQG